MLLQPTETIGQSSLLVLMASGTTDTKLMDAMPIRYLRITTFLKIKLFSYPMMMSQIQLRTHSRDNSSTNLMERMSTKDVKLTTEERM